MTAAGETASPAGADRPVFISYASADAVLAERACAALEDAGIPCWIAPRDVRPGDPYAAAIVEAITASKLMVVVLTQAAGDRAISKPNPRASARRRARSRRPFHRRSHVWLGALPPSSPRSPQSASASPAGR